MNNKNDVNVFVGITGRMVCDYHACSIWENKAMVMAAWYKHIEELKHIDNTGYEWDAYIAPIVFEDYERRLIEEAKNYPDCHLALDFYFNMKREGN